MANKTLKITQVRSQIGQSQRHRGTLRALGLGKIGRSAEHKDSPELQGMLRQIRHLVTVEATQGNPINVTTTLPGVVVVDDETDMPDLVLAGWPALEAKRRLEAAYRALKREASAVYRRRFRGDRGLRLTATRLGHRQQEATYRDGA